MSQVNFDKSPSFDVPGTNQRGLGIRSDGIPVVVKEDGTSVPIGQSKIPIVANRGIGLVEDLPPIFNMNDVYVTNDTYEYYVALTENGWTPSFLEDGQFVTDASGTLVNPPVYQFVLGQLSLIITKIVTDELDFSSIVFDANGVSEQIVPSDSSFSYDINYLYMKRTDGTWIRSKIHKETNMGGNLP